jgi:hypothetical protein
MIAGPNAIPLKPRNSCNSIFKLIMTRIAHPDWLTTYSEPSAATAPMRTVQLPA